MKINFDPQADALYLYLRPFEDGDIEETIEADKGINVDVDKNGVPLGIEILGFSHRIESSDFTDFASFAVALKPFYSIHEVASLLNIDEETVRRKVKRGEIPAIRLGGRAGYRIERSKIRDFIELKKHRAA